MTLRALALAFGLFAATASAQPSVVTSGGRLAGTERAGVASFLGIPYAAPPSGAQRWRAPRPAAPWRGRRDATRFGPACYQGIAGAWGPYSSEFIASPPQSEDCLTLNVWKPSGARRGLPVFVFIHGGAFQGGAGSVPVYEGSDLAARGAVVITINYRVGVMGFMAHPGLTAESPLKTSGNYGLLDQIAALRWIKANVGRFGGNPANVTVAGESAGAASVNDLLVMPMARGLFQRAVSFSGAGMGISTPPRALVEAKSKVLGTTLGAPDVAALRALPADTLTAATSLQPGQPGEPPMRWLVPNVDGTVLSVNPDKPGVPVASRVPLLTGFNAAEMIDPSVRTPADFERAARSRYGASADRLLALYPHGTEAEVARSNLVMARDRYMTGLILWARNRVATTGQPVYLYLYDHPYPPAPGGQSWGAFHSSGLPYVFGALGKGGRVFTAADRAISRQWQDHLLAFMRTGAPGAGWLRVDRSSAEVMAIGDRRGMEPAVSTPERFAAFRAYAASGGNLGLI